MENPSVKYLPIKASEFKQMCQTLDASVSASTNFVVAKQCEAPLLRKSHLLSDSNIIGSPFSKPVKKYKEMHSDCVTLVKTDTLKYDSKSTIDIFMYHLGRSECSESDVT